MGYTLTGMLPPAREQAKIKVAKEWTQAQRILCIRLDTIGDVLMTTPAIRALKESGSNRQITLLTSPVGALVAKMIPEVDEVITYEAPWMKATDSNHSSARDREMIELLSDREFDAAVIFTVFSQNPLPAALMCQLADIPLRLAHCRENPYQLLTTWVHETEPESGIRHEVQRQLDLVARAGSRTTDPRLSLAVPLECVESASLILREAGVILSQPWIILHPGATAPSRRYPPGQFAKVATQIAHSHGIPIVMTGDETDIPLVDSIHQGIDGNSITLAGRLSLAELCAAISMASVVLTNNTGPAHICAAVGTPVVDLYALTNPQHTPWMVKSRVLSFDVPCKYCFKSVCPEKHHACLERITPEEVVEAFNELFLPAQAELVAGWETGASRLTFPAP